MKITQLKLYNYRCYPKLQIDFNSDITVLLARNGQGKTAVLDAVTVALVPYLGVFDESIGSHFSNHDARRVPHKLENGRIDMETQYPVSLEAVGTIIEEKVEWQREKQGDKRRTTIKNSSPLIKYAKELQTSVRNGESVTLPLLAYYGTGRLWKEKRLTEKKQAGGSSSRLSGYMDCMNPESSYRAFADWLRMENLIEYEQALIAKERGNLLI